MNKQHRNFFSGLNRIYKNDNGIEMDLIDINNFTLEELTSKYEQYIKWYYSFLKSIKTKVLIKESQQIKRQYDKIYRFWINPFHIALRNTIGKLPIKEQEIYIRTPDKGDRARLTQETIDNIKNKYRNSRLTKQTQPDFTDSKSISEVDFYSYERVGLPIEILDKIRKYRITFQEKGIQFSKEFYGEIDFSIFRQDKGYQRFVLEAIENLEIENDRTHFNNKYLGRFYRISNNGKIVWQQEISEGDIDAIAKIVKLEEKYKNMMKWQELEEKEEEEEK